MTRPGQTSARGTAPGSLRPERSRVNFRFEGRSLAGIAGEPIAKALFSNGIRTLSYSVKYHNPRSIFCGRGRCSMCQLEVDGAPGVKACTTPLRNGMDICRQDSGPWFAPILTAVIRRVPFPAGFYYRYFTRPRPVREMFLGTLRQMAGVGRIPLDAPAATPAPAPKPRAGAPVAPAYDVVVVGAGVSGMAAALGAAGEGARVLLVDEYSFLGGHSIGALADPEQSRHRDELVRAVGAAPPVTVVTGAVVQGLFGGNTLVVSGGDPVAQRRVRAGALVLATGALDAVPLFENNDLPGVFGPRGLRLLLERDGIALGTRAVVYGSGPPIADASALLRAHGVRVVAVVETSDERSPALADEHHGGGTLVSVRGREWVRSATFDTPAGRIAIACDLVCIATPGQPSFELAQQAGFQFAFSGAHRHDVDVMAPTARRPGLDGVVHLVGEAAGILGWREKVERAAATGAAAAGGRRE